MRYELFHCHDRPPGPELEEAILALDREHMTPVLEAVGLRFPTERRLSGMRRPGAMMAAAFDVSGALAVYLAWGPHFKLPEAWYIDSMQIRTVHRPGGAVFRTLCRTALTTCRERALTGPIQVEAQQSKPRMLRILSRLGFREIGTDCGTVRLESSLRELCDETGRLRFL